MLTAKSPHPMPQTTTEKRLLLHHYRKKGQHFLEPLSDNVAIDMVIISGGQFLMGAPEDELESEEWEKPQHSVTVNSFAIGHYPITQAQWEIVASLDRVDEDLESDPSHFKGANRPVEQVSWEDAVEFCKRLSVKTGRLYRLPSEAEWEYACRAGTTTPFHFGETLGDELANYCAQDEEIGGKKYKGAYGRGVEGKYREETTEVGLFPPNDFGLCDMHGNVWEWCEDDWHENYEDAPKDGSVWRDQTEKEASKDYKILRGGSWFFLPRHCRSACRFNDTRVDRYFNIGFRVSCELPRTFS